jgi:hypothetical protein
MSNFNVTVLDYVEEGEWEGKKYLRLVDKSGVEWRLGKHLEAKYADIKTWALGTPVKLTMATFTKNGESKEYVKDIEKAVGVLTDQLADKLAPRKNIGITSAEEICAVRCVVDMMIASTVSIPDDIKDMAFEWIRNKLEVK